MYIYIYDKCSILGSHASPFIVVLDPFAAANQTWGTQVIPAKGSIPLLVDVDEVAPVVVATSTTFMQPLWYKPGRGSTFLANTYNMLTFENVRRKAIWI